MACDYVYKGQTFTKQQLEQYLKDNPKEVSDVLTSLQSNTPIKKGVDFVFKENPELSIIGTQEQYSQYLNTIFPDSKVKDIVYHGTLPQNKFEKFDKQKGTNLSGEYGGIHFGDLTAAIERPTKVVKAENFLAGIEEDLLNFKPNIIPVILNINNIKRVEEGKNWGQGDWSNLISKENEADGYVYTNKIENKGKDSYVVFEPEQIHILGSKEDIEGFKQYIQGKPNSVKSGVEELFNENLELASIGTPEQYSQYLDTIFPDSKVKDIVYHGADEKIEKFTLDKKKNKKEKGLFFFSKKSSAQLWRDASFEEDNTQQGDLIYALLNIKNPEIIDFENKSAWDMAKYANENIKGDGLIAINVDEMYVGRDTQYAAFKPEQIHILGNKQDIEGFKEFVQGKPNSVKPGVSELFESNPELASQIYEALGFKNKLKTYLGKELEYKDPYVPQSRLKSFKQYEVLNESGDNIGTVVVEYRGNESVILHPKLNVISKGYGKDLYKLISSKFNVEVQEWSEGAIVNSDSAKKMWDSLEKEGSAKRIVDEQGDNFRVLNYRQQITPQQKQQAQQLYSQYLDSLNKPNTNPILQINQEEQVKKFTELQERLNSKEFLEGAKNAYENSEGLKSFGTQEEYNDYIARVSLGIIKNPSSGEYNYTSKVKDIVYHGTKYRAKLYNGKPLVWFNDINDDEAYFIYEDTYDIKNKIRLSYEDYEKLPQYRFEKFKKKEHRYAGGDTFLGTGIYFTTSKEDANKGYNREGLYSAIIDVKNPYTENKGYSNSRSGKGSQELIDKGYDSVTEKINNGQEYNVFDPEQIHILGSKQDVEGFKEFVNNDNINLQPNITQEQQQERDDYRELLDTLELTENEKNKLSEAFIKSQDLDGVINLQPNTTPGFENIPNKLKKLRESLDKKFTTFKINNSGKKNTVGYKSKFREYSKTIQDIDKKIQELNTENIENVSNYLKAEIEELNEALDSYRDDSVLNEDLIERINFLSSFVLGKDIYNNDKPKWDLSDISDWQKEIFEPVAKLLDKKNKFELDEIFKKATNLPSFIDFKERKGLSEEEFKEYFLQEVSKKRKDLNVLQKNWTGMQSTDDNILAEILIQLYHKDVDLNKNPIRASEKKLAELQDKLQKQGFDQSKFIEKNERGVETDVIATLYSSKYRDEEKNFKELLVEYNQTSDKNVKEKAKAYNNLISWLKLHSNVINYSKLSVVNNMYKNHPKLSQYLVYDEKVIKEYEEHLKNILGKEYNKIINGVINNIEEYLEEDNHQFTKNPKYYDIFYYENNPFEFQKNYFNNETSFKPIEIRKETGLKRFTTPKYSEFIPRDKKYNVDAGIMESTGYYNQNFRDEIMSNDNAYEAWNLMVEILTNYINPTYRETGQYLKDLSWAKIDKDIREEILSNKKDIKNISTKLLSMFKDTWTYSKNAGDNKVIKPNYYDNSSFEIYTTKKALEGLTLKSLKDKAKEIGLTKIEGISKENLIDDIANKVYYKSKSNNIIRNTLALLELSAIQKARNEGRMVAEMIYNQYSKTLDLKDRIRSEANQKMENWIGVNYYNTDSGEDNVEIKSLNKKLTESEKFIKDTLKEMLAEYNNGEDISFKYNDITYKKVKGHYYVVEDDKNKKISEEEYYEAIKNYVNDKISKLGTPYTIDSLLRGVLSNMAKKSFFINPESGIFNRLEGILTNLTNDADGKFWKRGNYDVSRKFMTGANFLKLAPERIGLLHKNHYLQLQTFQHLVEELGLIQDRKNEIERQNLKHNKLHKYTNVFAFAIDNPEFKNQTEILLSILQDIKVKDNNGVEHPFFDSKTMSFTLYKPGTTELKDEFKNDNNKQWENFLYEEDGKNQLYLVKERATDAISQIQGNYSDVDSIRARHHKSSGGVNWGVIFSAYMRWFPSQVNQRFGYRKSYLHVVEEQKGRWHILKDSPYVGGAYFSTMLSLTLGPGAIITSLPFVIGLGKMAYDKYVLKKEINSQLVQIKTLAGFLQETLARTIGFPMRFFFRNTDNSILKNNKLNNLLTKDYFMQKLSEQDKGAIKAMAQELASQINILLLVILLKSLLHGGSGDDDDEKALHNFIDNNGSRMLGTLAMWSNPKQLVQENSQFAILRSVGNIYKILEDTWKVYNGDNIDKSRLPYNIIKEQPFIPIPNVVSKAVFKGDLPFYHSKEYQSSQWFDRYTKTAEWRNEQQYKKKRHIFKEAYTDYLKEMISEDKPSLTDEQVEDIVDKQVRSKMNKKDMRRKTDETYEDALKRIDFKKDFEN